MDIKTIETLKVLLRPYKEKLYPLLKNYPRIILLFERLRRNVFHFILFKKKAFTTYSIVSACFNVEDYIDEFVDSIVKQTLSFKNNIQLILVDDGSTDTTYKKLKLWQTRYPENILVLHQKNQGQAVARNFGLRYVCNDWVCFADSDDFFDVKALEKVDTYIKQHQNVNLSIISIRLIPFYEEIKGFVDDHPLGYRFHQSVTMVPVNNDKQLFQLSVNSAFFSKTLIEKANQEFNPLCKPGFEDALFVNSLILLFPDSYIAFLKDALYYYRKRERKNSTIDNSMTNQDSFSLMLTEGVIKLLRLAKINGKNGTVPLIPQQVSLYATFWYFSWLVDNEERLSFMTGVQKENFFRYLQEIYKYIDVSTIQGFKLKHFDSKLKIGILGSMKGEFSTKNIEINILRYDQKNNEILLSYDSYKPLSELFLVDGREVSPRFSKTIEHTFLSRLFLTQRLIWLPLGKEGNSKLEIYVGGTRSRFKLRELDAKEEIGMTEIKEYFCSCKNNSLKKYENCWLISDRDIQADDNGEHLYRFILQNHSEINAYFLLNRDSHDWDRLKSEGFRLIPYGSHEHKQALKGCVRIISSHADVYVHSYFGDKTYPTFVFLQHGVTHNDLHQWLNTKTIDLLVTSSPKETSAFIENGTKYLLTEKEVKLLGMPRHDQLLRMNKKEKIILVMPTWRSYLVGRTILGNVREINNNFEKSRYAIYWGNFLRSQELEHICREFGYKVVFFPHVNMQPYLSINSLPGHIDVQTHTTTRIQSLFAAAALMITDYSSVAFEMAYLRKPVIYYQFDADEVLSNKHIFSQGYFSYVKNGFGDVVYTQPELFNSIKKLLSTNCVAEDKFLKRMVDFFPLKDGNNCKRCFDAINSLSDRA